MKFRLRWSSPLTQILLVSVTCFCCPGMFNALNGLGGGGKADTTATNNANTALAVTFTVFSLIGGGIFNLCGHYIMVPGALMYALYVGSYLSDSSTFTIATGATLGIGAGLLWSSQGAIMMSYPMEKDKGKYFAIFWAIFNLGSTIGSAIALANEWRSNDNTGSVGTGTYIAFICIMGVGAFSALLLLPASKVYHSDGTPVSMHKYSNVTRECIGIFKLFTNWKMLILIPLFGGSNWFYTYQFQVYNGGGYFNLRARTLNNLLYWVFQIIGAGVFGSFMDWARLGGRRRRAWCGLTVVFLIMAATWIGGIFVQLKFSRESVKGLTPSEQQDAHGGVYAGELITYALFGVVDSIYQGFCYWLMGALTNDTERAARYGGFYKTTQNAFAAIAPQLDVNGVSYLVQLIVCWIICVVGMAGAVPVIMTIEETTEEVVDNLKGIEGKEVVVGGALEVDIKEDYKESINS